MFEERWQEFINICTTKFKDWQCYRDLGKYSFWILTLFKVLRLFILCGSSCWIYRRDDFLKMHGLASFFYQLISSHTIQSEWCCFILFSHALWYFFTTISLDVLLYYLRKAATALAISICSGLMCIFKILLTNVIF